ncbi:phosphodiester glycosidase family protein [Clostridium estertheticum]|uniref:Phosphodiester glycosidase family protein n=1 Tax=Clostridium estertheticum TaxID=238834 RepID=A0AA47EL90_9CLOT|nr:phosphodiester glycosidase family protein [Clostridium estertheticum]MBU3156708.1 phosphodiester glycosidase family protein [Clostridium estertheticum]MBU3199115.1 phosphodiester glycosidase family protein [Clostridium estertheticum]WAG62266.1 phosphodiester glycosidase family protein [Clostridium estertheticum]WAG63622.1 phosphodiester glycosidase family protein [Clostridium estertheticum]
MESMKVKNKKHTSIHILMFLIFELVFTIITGPFMVYYGPFKNVKSTVVGSAMTTLTLQYLVTSFLSEEKINQIMSDQKIEVIAQNNTNTVASGVVVKNKNNNGIERYDVKGKKFKGYLLVINDPTRLKVGYSSKLGSQGEITSTIAKHNNAIAAINGGAFTDKTSGTLLKEVGANPAGVIISSGKVVYDGMKDENQKRECVAFTKSGKLLVGLYSIKEMKGFKVTEAVSFGPAMIVNGKKAITKGDGGWGIAPRTCIAQKKDGTILLLVIDGRELSSIGATLRDVQDVLYKYGAYNATNLDGGSSSTMFYNDQVINKPCGSEGERTVPSIIYVEKR